jgi:hypothetical protein
MKTLYDYLSQEQSDFINSLEESLKTRKESAPRATGKRGTMTEEQKTKMAVNKIKKISASDDEAKAKYLEILASL